MASLTIGKPSNTGASVNLDGNANVVGINMNVAGPITAYGSSVIVTQPLTITGNGDIFMQGFSNATDGINIYAAINKTGGGDATLTLKSNQRLNTNANITAVVPTPGKLNMIFWSDADGTRNGGVSFFNNPTLTSKGGHIWMGGNGGAAANAQHHLERLDRGCRCLGGLLRRQLEWHGLARHVQYRRW